MKEFKFRAWDRKNKSWIYSDHNTENGIAWFWDMVHKYQCHVMQFTGILDRHGKEIYDGDCIGGIYTGLHVGWCDKCGSFQLFGCPYCFCCEGDLQWLEFVNDEEKEIIGNIYANIELTAV